MTTIKAVGPEAELYKYAATLRAITQGRSHHTRKLAGYEPTPHGMAQKVAVRRDVEGKAEATAAGLWGGAERSRVSVSVG